MRSKAVYTMEQRRESYSERSSGGEKFIEHAVEGGIKKRCPRQRAKVKRKRGGSKAPRTANKRLFLCRPWGEKEEKWRAGVVRIKPCGGGGWGNWEERGDYRWSMKMENRSIEMRSTEGLWGARRGVALRDIPGERP